MSESMFGDAGAARNSRRRSTARTGSAKSPATTPGQSAGELPATENCFSCKLASGQQSLLHLHDSLRAYSWLLH